MCGITRIFAFNEAGRFHLINLQKSIEAIKHRGPDAQGSFLDEFVGLGHRRLAVIDTNIRSNQPMKDSSGRYTIVYNGEFYNYQEIRKQLIQEFNINFRTESDTEVLLYAYIQYKEKCLDMINGFFAFSIFDSQAQELFIARDRIGIKPLYYFHDEDKFLFASELRSIINYGINRSLSMTSLLLYLQLNYIPAPFSILEGVSKLLPGHYIRVKKKSVAVKEYYSINKNKNYNNGISFDESKSILLKYLEESIEKRLISDVPIGVFLSGGIDSSIITALASRYQEKLKTFSMGYQNNSFFDEKKYAQQVSDHFKTEHHIFDLSNQDLLNPLNDILDHFDEPFADSSSIPVYLLSKLSRDYVSVALSGDGADEIFSGYNKHRAFYKASQNNAFNSMVKLMLPLWRMMPRSRNNAMMNSFRQLERYGSGLKLSPKERYWHWAGFMGLKNAMSMINTDLLVDQSLEGYHPFKQDVLQNISSGTDINEILITDTHLVLPNDMLYKVDHMSMAHGLEVRVPFLDHRIVEFGLGLPEAYKINNKSQKIILRELLKELLPNNLHKRPKHGFEIPMLNWLRKDLKPLITEDLLSDSFIRKQGIFNEVIIRKMKKKLFSSNPQDSHAHIWALIVFQSWWKKYLN